MSVLITLSVGREPSQTVGPVPVGGAHILPSAVHGSRSGEVEDFFFLKKKYLLYLVKEGLPERSRTFGRRNGRPF